MLLCDISRLNHPCSFLDHAGTLWRNVFWWLKSWGEVGCHHVTYTLITTVSVFRSTVHVIKTAFQIFFSPRCLAPSVLSCKLKSLCIPERGTHFVNSTALFTLVLSFCKKTKYKKKEKKVLYTSWIAIFSKCFVLVLLFSNCMLHSPISPLFFLFFLPIWLHVHIFSLDSYKHVMWSNHGRSVLFRRLYL